MKVERRRVSPLREPGVLVKPRLRGLTHLYAFYASLVMGALLVLAAPGGRARFAVGVYAVGLSGMLGASALLHRGIWSAQASKWLLRLDHSMIFVMIAGTYTPLALLALSSWVRPTVLIVAWGGTAFGILFELGRDHLPPGWVTSVYVTIGWLGVLAMPQLWTALGPLGPSLIVGGGLFYTVGAIVHATHWPDPDPLVFGYHEVFHALVLVAALMHYACIAFVVLPKA